MNVVAGQVAGVKRGRAGNHSWARVPVPFLRLLAPEPAPAVASLGTVALLDLLVFACLLEHA